MMDMEDNAMRKKIFTLMISILFLVSAACGCSDKQGMSDTNKLDPLTAAETSSLEEKKKVSAGELTYTNLNSESSLNEVQSALKASGIREEHVDKVVKWVRDYNACMKDCESFSLVGDFVTVDKKAVDYGDYYLISKEWFKKNKREYYDILCRIAAFELNRDNITVKNAISKDEFNCWDDEKSWLYSDGDAILGRGADEGEYGEIPPFPMLDWNDQVKREYFTLFDPVSIEENCSEEEMFRAIDKKWSEYGISFNEGSYSLITFWLQVENETAASHAATLIETEYGLLLFEKTNPVEPYAATKFDNMEEVKGYLYEKMKLEYEKDGDIVPKYIILKNNKKI